MADTRIAVQRQSWRNSEWANETNGHLRARTEIARFRNDLRAAFVAPRYRVSDIAEWPGSSGSFGHAFVFRDTTFGHEYLFGFFSRNSSGNAWMYQAWGNNSGSTMGTRFRAWNSSSLSDPSTPSSFGCIAYNHNTSSSYGFGFNDTTALTYTSGDFAAPASSPYTALGTFMPSSRLFGLEGAQQQGGSYNRGHLLYDPEIGVLRYDLGYGGYGGAQGWAWIAGEIFRPNADGGLASATDTNRRGIIHEQRYGQSSTSMNGGVATYYLFVQFIRESGVLENQGAPTNVLSNYTRANYRVSGDIDYRKLRVEVAGYFKGFLDPRIICEVFPYNDVAFKYQPLQLPGETEKPLLKTHSNFASMWKHNYPFYDHLPDKVLWTG